MKEYEINSIYLSHKN